MLRALALALSLVTAAGCATLRTPSEGGRPWHELRSEHVTMYTDLAEDEAIEAVRAFEDRHHLLATALFGDAPPPLRSRVVAFRNERDFHSFAPESVGAYYTPMLALDAQPTPTIVMYGGPTADTYSIWLHELTHRFLRFSMGTVPTWLNEGLAEYYSTARADGEILFLGEHLDDIAFVKGGGWRSAQDRGTRRLMIPITQIPAASQLIGLDPTQFYLRHGTRERDDLNRTRQANYAGAWALAHMLISHPDYRARYEQLVTLIGEGRSANDVVCDALGDISAAKLDADLLAYVQRSTLTVWPQAYEPPPAVAPQVTSLFEARVLVLWAKLGAHRPGFERMVPAFLGRSLSRAPGDPWVLETAGTFARQMGDAEQARARLEEARRIAPTTQDPLLALMTLYDDHEAPWPAEQREEWLRAVVDQLEPIASTASELNALAWYLARHERAEEALSLSRRALQADPNCGACFDTHALVSFERGELDQAVQAQRVAIERVSEHASEDVMAAFQERLHEYEAAAHATNGPQSADPGGPKRCWGQ